MEIKFTTTNNQYDEEFMFMFNFFGKIELVSQETEPLPVFADEWYVPTTYYNWNWKIKPGMEEAAKNYYSVITNADLLA